MVRIGIDTGGTFTDFVIVSDGRITTWKEPSTPDDPSRAILKGIARVARALEGAEVIHGSTVATNALLEGKTARIAFITNRGFEDLLEIGRQARPDLYNLSVERPPPLAPRDLRFGIAGRIRPDGSQAESLDPAELERLADRIGSLGVEAVAICLLHSYANTSHEERAAAMLARTGLPVSASSRLVSEYREYERASTAAVNAAVAPAVSGYLARLGAGLREAAGGRLRGFRIMGSNGGALSPRAAGEEAVRTVLSGPAAGVRAALHVGRMIGRTDLISFDMGGTSTDVCLIPGEVRTTGEAVVAGHPVKIPTIDIHTVGAGGGSIAWRDAGGALRVGPASAGADPGPACYGRGGPPTVTDAHLMLGRIVTERFLDGRMELDPQASAGAISALAETLDMDPSDAAEGILEVAEATMARAIRVISLHRGYEPGDFTLLAFGGAGGLHAASLASSLGMDRAVIPAGPGVFSAYGMTVADVLRDLSATVLIDAQTATAAQLEESFAVLERACREDLEAEGVMAERMLFERTLDARYRGQSYEINLPWARDWLDPFHEAHLRRYGYFKLGQPVELVTLRVRGVGRVDPPGPQWLDAEGKDLRGARQEDRDLTWRGRQVRIAVYDRPKLPPATRATDAATITGPALILESGATTFVPPGWEASLDPPGNLHLRQSRDGRGA